MATMCPTVYMCAGCTALCRSVPLLQQLDLRFNPVQRHKAYSVTLSALTSLTMLDGQTLVGEQVEQANSLTPALMRQSAKLWHSDAGEHWWHLIFGGWTENI